ncbi:uncharacterized mitochondrial protein AtMg00860-like [Tripterygium wilfordii]|uniref:uncharacterized mitochondrial protein AtMg00860-like n=1 Tax=Tripterygium wilfordii TaxID=458696 RepID=UPI0018F85B7E|nr:uncharacterized mitochondrial protein AtMg00860-like [Tripterygium wilfordii]
MRFPVAVDPVNVEAVIAWRRPKNVGEIRSFLELAGYYRRFIEGFSRIAAPMTQLTRKDVLFVWSDECEQAFLELKTRLMSPPVLVIPDREDRVVKYTSPLLKPHERNYPVHDLELVVVVSTLK